MIRKSKSIINTEQIRRVYTQLHFWKQKAAVNIFYLLIIK